MVRLYRIRKKGGIARNTSWLRLLKIFRLPLKKSFLAAKGGSFAQRTEEGEAEGNLDND
jgi:hypothetical protein